MTNYQYISALVIYHSFKKDPWALKAIDGTYIAANSEYKNIFGLNTLDIKGLGDRDLSVITNEFAAIYARHDCNALLRNTPLKTLDINRYSHGIDAYITQRELIISESGEVLGIELRFQSLAVMSNDMHITPILFGANDRFYKSSDRLPVKLKPKDESIFYLMLIGFTNQRIAEVNSLSVKTVEASLNKVRNMFNEHLGGEVFTRNRGAFTEAAISLGYRSIFPSELLSKNRMSTEI